MNLDHLLTGRRNQQSPPLPHTERLPNPFLGGGGGGGGGETSRRTAGPGAMASKQQQSQKASTIPGTGTGTTAQADQQPQPQEQPDDSMNELSKLLGLYDSEYDQARRHLGGHGEEASRKEAPRKVVRKEMPTAMGDQQALSNMDIFVGALDGGGSTGTNDVGPAMHAQHQHMKQHQPQDHQVLGLTRAGGSSLRLDASSASPGVLSSYSGNADAVSSVGSRSSSQQQQQQQQQQARASSSMTMSALLGTQAQAQASYGIDADASNMNNFGAGGSGGGGNANMAQLQNANTCSGMSFHGAANLQNGDTCINRMMPPPSANFPMSSCDINNNRDVNISDMMTGGGGGGGGGGGEFGGLNNPGRLTPPSHPSAQQHGQDSASLLGLASSSFTTLQQRNNTFQQQQQQQSLMGGSLGLTTPSPLETGSVTSLPSVPQNVLRSQSVGSVQSTTSIGSAGSSGVARNSRTGRMAGRGGFPGPGRALGLKRLRARSDGSTGSAGSNSLGLSLNSAATKSKTQALLRLHASVGGKQANAEGMYPIHIACRDYPTNARLIGTLLCTSPGVGRLIVGRGSSSASSLNSAESSTDATASAMAGSYPIHIALAHSASLDVVGLLVRQNPELLIKGDGTNRVPLSIAFSRRASLDVLDLLLGMNPNAAALPDSRNNYPLHLACARGTGGSGERFNLPLLKRLLEAYPAAVHKRNFNGKTPLDLAQAGGLADDDAISYLHEMAYMESDDAVIEAPDA